MSVMIFNAKEEIMEFNYIVGRRLLGNKIDIILGGFATMELAKDYAEMVEVDYNNRGYMYLDASDGRHILGADLKDEKNVWYGPSQEVFVYDSKVDRVVNISKTKL